MKNIEVFAKLEGITVEEYRERMHQNKLERNKRERRISKVKNICFGVIASVTFVGVSLFCLSMVLGG